MRSGRILSGLAPTPLTLAGYLAWVAVAIGLWQEPTAHAGLGVSGERTVTVLCMVCFLVGFAIRASALAQQATSNRNILALSLMIASTVTLLALGTSGFTPILLIVIAAVFGATYPPRVAVMSLAVLNVAFLAALITRWRIADPAFTLLIYGLFQAFALLTTLERVRAQRVSQDLREVNAQLLATRELLAESARDGERLRVSRELHDVAGHRLTALALNLNLLGQEAAVSQRREWLVSRGLVTDLLAELSSVVASLRRHDGIDVREALRRIADAFPAPRIHLELNERVRIEGADRAEVIVRAGQEGLTNAVRHANARNIWLSLSQGENALRLEIRDDGPARAAHAMGNGLRGMQERVELLGGRVTTDAAPQGGFRLQVILPTEPQP
jgi:signal transduction histidine kinase